MLNHVGTVRLETPRLVLRRYTLDDAGDMFRNWVRDPEVCRFWSWEPHTSIEETRALLADWVDAYGRMNHYHWVIEHRGMSQAVGFIYLSDVDDTDSSASVHYALSRALWGQGITTEACVRVLDFAFETLGAERVHSHHHADNPASGRVILKAGMRYTHTVYRDFPGCARINGDYRYYEVTREGWGMI